MNSADRYAQDLLDRQDDEPGPLVAGYLWTFGLVVTGLPVAALFAAPVIAALVLP